MSTPRFASGSLSILAILLLHSPKAFSLELTFDRIAETIRAKRIVSIETLLPALPRDFRAHYTLMENSRSAQAASPTNPRAIVFGKTATLICAFNGDEGQVGGDAFECIQWMSAERRFSFRQIVFPSRFNGLREAAFSTEGKSVDGTTSCGTCHGNGDPRPNWHEYRIWAGAYGGADDQITPEQSARYASFVALRDTHPRYRHLVQGKGPYEPFTAPRVNNLTLSNRPNLDLSERIGRMNARRGARILESLLSYPELLDFSLRVLSCGNSSTLPNAGQFPDYAAHEAEYLTRTFKQVGVSADVWTTRLPGDPSQLPFPYEFLAGSTYHNLEVVIALLQNRAAAGDQIFVQALRSLKYDNGGHPEFDAEFRALEKILPDVGFFSGAWEKNRGSLCEALVNAVNRG